MIQPSWQLPAGLWSLRWLHGRRRPLTVGGERGLVLQGISLGEFDISHSMNMQADKIIGRMKVKLSRDRYSNWAFLAMKGERMRGQLNRILPRPKTEDNE